VHTDTDRQEDPSYLFLVRVWAEDAFDGRKKWCGRVQNVVQSDAYSFDELPALIDHLLSMLPRLETGERETDS
jgi:hypothetical protein